MPFATEISSEWIKNLRKTVEIQMTMDLVYVRYDIWALIAPNNLEKVILLQ